jgi:hypothetical protein
MGIVGLTLLILGASCAQATTLEEVSPAIAAGEAAFSLRYRYEHVDQDGLAEDAAASTARARLTC